MRAGQFNINDYLDKLYEAFDEKEKGEKDDDEKEEKEEKEEKDDDDKSEKPEGKKPSGGGAPSNSGSKELSKSSKSPNLKNQDEQAPSKGPTDGKAEDPNKGGTQLSAGGQDLTNEEGIVMPDQNQKVFKWLKSEFQKGKTEVKVEMKLGDKKFEPGYDLQTDLDSVKEFKPGMFGEIKTGDTKGGGASGVPAKNTGDATASNATPAPIAKGEGEAQKNKPISQSPDQKAAAPTKTAGIGGAAPAKPTNAAPAKPTNAAPPAEKPEGEEDEAKVEDVDLKTKKEKDAK